MTNLKMLQSMQDTRNAISDTYAAIGRGGVGQLKMYDSVEKLATSLRRQHTQMKAYFDSVLNGPPGDVLLEDIITLWSALQPCPKPEKDPNTGLTITNQLVAFVGLAAARELMVRQVASDSGIKTWEIDIATEANYADIPQQCAQACLPAPATDDEKMQVWDLGR